MYPRRWTIESLLTVHLHSTAHPYSNCSSVQWVSSYPGYLHTLRNILPTSGAFLTHLRTSLHVVTTSNCTLPHKHRANYYTPSHHSAPQYRHLGRTMGWPTTCITSLHASNHKPPHSTPHGAYVHHPHPPYPNRCSGAPHGASHPPPLLAQLTCLLSSTTYSTPGSFRPPSPRKPSQSQ